MDDDDDLFAVRPAAVATVATPVRSAKSETEAVAQPNPKIDPVCQPAAPVKRRPRKVGPPALMLKTPSGIVATFSCVCGAQDEVLEPAPLTVDCWSCKRPGVRRWACPYDPPAISARQLTDDERSRIP